MIGRAEEFMVTISKKFTYLAICFIVGVFAGSFLEINFENIKLLIPLLFSFIFLALFVNSLLKNTLFVWVGFCVFFFLIGSLYFLYFESKTYFDWPIDSDVVVIASIVARPERNITEQKVLLRTNELEVNNKLIKLGDALLLAKLSLRDNLQYGDEIKIYGRISKPFSNEEFDYRRYLMKYPVYGVINRAQKVENLPHSINTRQRALRSLHRFSEKLENSLNLALPEPHASLAAGIILGQRRSLPDKFIDNLNRVGLSHIVAISGYNITVIFAVLGDVLAVYLSRRRVFWFGTVLALFFIFMTGLSPSIIRAAIFSILILFGGTIGRRASQINLMLLAAALMLLFNPFLLRYDLGFELSFLAFIGLIYLSPLLKSYLCRIQNSFLQTWILVPLGETLGAQIAVTPLVITQFGRLSLISPLSNLLVIVPVELSMAFAFLTAFLGLFSYWLAKFCAFLLWPVLEYIIKVVEVLGGLPVASIEFGKGVWAIEAVMYVVLLIVLKKNLRKNSLG